MPFTAHPQEIPLWPNGAPGSEDWPQQEQETRSQPHGHTFVRNVTRPSITVHLPDPALASGAAAIICPGGAFHFLTMDNEGSRVAEWLNARGVAAFVLKYRVTATSPDDAAFAADSQRVMADPPDVRERHMAEVTRRIAPLAVADAQRAMRLVRRRAVEWGVDPDRVGYIGFSAGGRVAVGASIAYDADTRPAFVAPIYGALYDELALPADAPPLFIAVAGDDALSAEPCLRLYRAWRAAEKSAELHVYAQGGHGFGMLKQGLPSDGWINRLGEWLDALGFLGRPS